MNKWLCAMLCILFCSCSDRTINATAHSSTASKDISLYNDGPAKSLLLMHVGPERKTISPVIFFSSEEGCLDAISDVPEYLREIVKKEPLRAEIISDLYKFIADKPPSRSALFGTTLIAFYRSKSRAQYTLDLNQMYEFKKQWEELSPLPLSVSEYFIRIGLSDNKISDSE